jgi:hypothetical protein
VGPTRAAGRTASPFGFEIAGARDEAAIRAFLRATPMPGRVRLSFEREPDALAAGAIEGDVHDVIVARERDTDSLAAMAARSSRMRYVNGRPHRVGYLSQLRVRPRFARRRDLLNGGFEFYRALHERDATSVYLASVVSENAGARRLLDRGRAGWPAFRMVDRLVTLAIPVRSVRPATGAPNGVEMVRGDVVDRADLVAVLERNNPRYQFAPCWTLVDLESSSRVRGPSAGEFSAALRGGRIVGCAAVWDQRAFKQVVVRGYSRPLGRCRSIVNVLARMSGGPRLPPIGSPLALAHLSHVAVDDDDPEVLLALVESGCRRAAAAGLEFLTFGTSAAGALYSALRRSVVHRSYESLLYVACWPDGRAVADGLDGRPSHPEMAVL